AARKIGGASGRGRKDQQGDGRCTGCERENHRSASRGGSAQAQAQDDGRSRPLCGAPQPRRRLKPAGEAGGVRPLPSNPRGQRLGGGLALHSPFGTFYVPNISPDRQKRLKSSPAAHSAPNTVCATLMNFFMTGSLSYSLLLRAKSASPLSLPIASPFQ